jgi:hypothetical protein
MRAAQIAHRLAATWIVTEKMTHANRDWKNGRVAFSCGSPSNTQYSRVLHRTLAATLQRLRAPANHSI